MMIDVSHVSEDTIRDVIRHSRSPVIASHSAAKALTDTNRNLSDVMIKAIAENGGVIQVSFYPSHVDTPYRTEYKLARNSAAREFSALGERYRHDPIGLDIAQYSLEKEIKKSIPAPPLSRVVDHIDHIVSLVGVEHVGLGSDFDGGGRGLAGLEHVGRMPAITDELIERGYAESDIQKILGENLLRVMTDNERLANGCENRSSRQGDCWESASGQCC